MTREAVMLGLLGLWVASEAAVMARDFHPAKGERRDFGSRSLVIVTTVLAILAAAAVSLALSAFLPGDPWLWLAAGGVLLLLGIVIRQRAVSWLGEQFRTHVTLFEGHRLIKDGPYARVRHPSYTGLVLTMIGFGLALGSLLSLGAMLFPVAALLYRIRVEERALAAHFGEEWTAYAARTGALFPPLA